jgi:GNAT superfamily N-acetyltransferase
MIIEKLVTSDLEKLSALQPRDWGDILPAFRFYLNTPFCHPFKAIQDQVIIGTGSLIFHTKTAWLAHIIVHPEYRGKGVGSSITDTLISKAHSVGYKTLLLIATELGAHVYSKFGFKTETEYFFFMGGAIQKDTSPDRPLIGFNSMYTDQLLALDQQASGEGRRALLNLHLEQSILYVEDGRLSGYYLPTLGEGVVIATHPQVGQALLTIKKPADRIVLPAENLAAIDFLHQSGYSIVQKATRMYLGEKMDWHPEMLYSRIGGNMG